MSAIFLSQSSKDNAMAEQIAVWLKNFGPQVAIPAGRKRKQELYHQLRLSLSADQ